MREPSGVDFIFLSAVLPSFYPLSDKPVHREWTTQLHHDPSKFANGLDQRIVQRMGCRGCGLGCDPRPTASHDVARLMLVSSLDGAVSNILGTGEWGLAGILTPYRGPDSLESSALTLVTQPRVGPSSRVPSVASRLVSEHMDPRDHPCVGWTFHREWTQSRGCGTDRSSKSTIVRLAPRVQWDCFSAGVNSRSSWEIAVRRGDMDRESRISKLSTMTIAGRQCWSVKWQWVLLAYDNNNSRWDTVIDLVKDEMHS